MNHESHETHEGGKEAKRSRLNWRKCVILLAAGFLAGGAVWVKAANQIREPSYKGYSLYEWLCDYEAIDRSYPLRDRVLTQGALEGALREPTAAIRQIGTNAIPSLLAWIENGPSLSRIHDLNASEREALHRAQLAVIGFELLGAEGRSACPALGRLASDPRKEDVAEPALDALVNIGGDAVPELVSILTNTNAPWRFKAAKVAGSFGTNSLAALPALLRCVKDSDEMVASFAAVALTELPARPEVVLPTLTNVLNDPRPSVRGSFVRLLSEHSPRPELVVPALGYALRDSEPEIRRGRDHGTIRPPATARFSLAHSHQRRERSKLRGSRAGHHDTLGYFASTRVSAVTYHQRFE
jgi:hypothetical protein